MLPLFLLLSVLAFLDGPYALSTQAPPLSGSWRPDLRRRVSNTGSTSLHARRQPVLEGIVTGVEQANNSTIVPVVFASDRETYYVLAGIGNVSLRLALDTASSDLWLVSSDCTARACNVPKYPLAFESPTFASVNSNATEFNVSYADSTAAQGFVARESISLGNLTVANQAIGLATSSNVTFTDQVSGVLGLGFSRLSAIASLVVNATSFMATMAQNGLLDYPLFGLSLTRDSSGTLAFVVPFAPFGAQSNVSSYLQWAVVLEGISPTYAAQTFNSSLALIDAGVGQWVVPCEIQETIGFNFGGREFVLEPTDYLIGPAAGNPALCLSWPQALPPSSDGIDWQLGSTFLRTVYSIYSFGINTKEPPMVGFYPLRNASAPVPPPASASAFFASYSATVPTTLPNFLLATPTFSTPAYTFNASVHATAGEAPLQFVPATPSISLDFSDDFRDSPQFLLFTMGDIKPDTIPLLTSASQYSDWVAKIKGVMLFTGCWGPVLNASPSEGEKLEDWKKKDDQAKGLIWMRTATNYHYLLETKEEEVDGVKKRIAVSYSAKDMWDVLKKEFGTPDTAEAISLLMSFSNLPPMTDTRPLRDQLGTYITRIRDASNGGMHFTESQQAVFILMKLPPSYSTLSTSLTSSHPLKDWTIESIQGKVLAEESLRSSTSQSVTRISKTKPKPSGPCDFCGSGTHHKSTCWKKHPDQRPKRGGKGKGKGKEKDKDKGKGKDNSNNHAHTAAPAVNVLVAESSSNMHASFYSAAHAAGVRHTHWLMDSGASQHIT
ncbi:hypothetical protein BN946_scf185015.g35 [Trametes cinnabarina]|uniref:Peptidase A1 domain-containing protein n=1 Tax=Pycnoporus cinnabarinus TaxID=5643 RepID=A0A060SGS5_PYCCI|nr:hypothetical protein BN946_scf185015.g35 [Trametes cinnabarina]